MKEMIGPQEIFMVVVVLFVVSMFVIVYLVGDIIKLNFSNKKKERQLQTQKQYRRIA